MSRKDPESNKRTHEPRPCVSDEELCLRYRERGDQEAFEELVHRYEGELFRYLRSYLCDSELAEDVFQGTFVQLYRKIDLFDEKRRFRPWLYAIATHQAIDTLRKLGRQPAVSLDRPVREAGRDVAAHIDLLPAETPSPLNQAVDEERRLWTRQAVDDLPDYLRVVVILVYFQGLKYGEAAEVLGLPIGTVKSRIHTALEKLIAAWRGKQVAVEPSLDGTSDVVELHDTPVHAEQAADIEAVNWKGFDYWHTTLASLAASAPDADIPAGLSRTTCLRLRETGLSSAPRNLPGKDLR